MCCPFLIFIIFGPTTCKVFEDKKNHINGIENFWNQTKCRIRKFNNVPKTIFLDY